MSELKRRCYLGEKFITCCTEICQFDNLRYTASAWQPFRQNDVVSNISLAARKMSFCLQFEKGATLFVQMPTFPPPFNWEATSGLAIQWRKCQNDISVSCTGTLSVSTGPLSDLRYIKSDEGSIQVGKQSTCLYERTAHDDVIKWKYFPRYWPFVWGIHRCPVNFPQKGQWRGTLMFSLIWAWINGWVNNREAGDLRRHRAHFDVSVMNCMWVGTKRVWALKSLIWELLNS